MEDFLQKESSLQIIVEKHLILFPKLVTYELIPGTEEA